MNEQAWRTALPRTAARYVTAAILGCTSLLCSAAFAAQVESLAWEDDAGSVLQIRVSGDSSYTTTSLEGGQRLRISLPNTTLGASAGELEQLRTTLAAHGHEIDSLRDTLHGANRELEHARTTLTSNERELTSLRDTLAGSSRSQLTI